jgi:single-stranded-DNA-specific exonuclease
MTTESKTALELAQKLDKLNHERRQEQDRIFAAAIEKLGDGQESVVVIGDKDWHEGVLGIVASKLMEKYSRPAFVLSVGDELAKGSGRSFGDFDMAAAIKATSQHLIKGGGHAAAGGVSLKPENIDKWRAAVNQFYASLSLKNQERFLLTSEDVSSSKLDAMELQLVDELVRLEPHGLGNERPVFRLEGLRAKFVDRIGKDKNHLKLTVSDGERSLKFLAFGAPPEWFVEPGDRVNVWVNLEVNEWQGQQTVEGRILRLELV